MIAVGSAETNVDLFQVVEEIYVGGEGGRKMFKCCEAVKELKIRNDRCGEKLCRRILLLSIKV